MFSQKLTLTTPVSHPHRGRAFQGPRHYYSIRRVARSAGLTSGGVSRITYPWPDTTFMPRISIDMDNGPYFLHGRHRRANRLRPDAEGQCTMRLDPHSATGIACGNRIGYTGASGSQKEVWSEAYDYRAGRGPGCTESDRWFRWRNLAQSSPVDLGSAMRHARTMTRRSTAEIPVDLRARL